MDTRLVRKVFQHDNLRVATDIEIAMIMREMALPRLVTPLLSKPCTVDQENIRSKQNKTTIMLHPVTNNTQKEYVKQKCLRV